MWWRNKKDWQKSYYELRGAVERHLEGTLHLLEDAEQASRQQRHATSAYRVEQAIAAIKAFREKWTKG